SRPDHAAGARRTRPTARSGRARDRDHERDPHTLRSGRGCATRCARRVVRERGGASPGAGRCYGERDAMSRYVPSKATDDWVESEESPARGMIFEVQRIRRRTMARPIPVILLAVVVTAVVTWRFATKKPLVEAQVVLALTEGSLSSHKTNIPVEQLRDYVK